MTKKLAAIIATSTFFAAAASVFADIDVGIKAPPQGVNPSTPVGTLLTNVLTIIFVVAGLAVLFMLLWGGFQWITSGGEKEKVDAARKRITNALIGLAILALAFLVVNVVGQILNINILNLQKIPTLGQQCTNAKARFNTATGECKAVGNSQNDGSCPAGTSFDSESFSCK